ncbi:hypothetical protein [Embleya sp. NPDC005575]|uniref:hypothetical protein n=1 Tax=Embleya sp. NPDC005575 TaxID=3156892 RepID=UPI0033BEEEA8
MSAPEAVDAYAAIHAARPGEVGAAAEGWRLAAARLTELRDALAETGRRGAQIWTGGGAEQFTERCHALADAADRLAAQGTALHEHLDEAAHALCLAQAHATDPTAAKAAATRLEGVYRDLGERLPVLPRPPRADSASGATRPAATAGDPNPARPCGAATTSPIDPADSAVATDPVDPVSPASVEAVPTSTDTPNRPLPPSPATPTASCEPPETPKPAVPAASEALAEPEAPAAPPAPPSPLPPPSPVATCMTATTPVMPPPDPPTAPAAALLPPPAIACALPPALPPPPVVGTPLSREPRQVRPAGIGPRVRRAAPPPSTPVAPVTGIRVAPGLRGGSGIDGRPAATHDAAHAAGPVPDLLGGTARDGASLTPVSPTWVTTPTTPGALTTPSTSAGPRPRPRPGSRYATHPAEDWWTDPQAPPQPT